MCDVTEVEKRHNVLAKNIFFEIPQHALGVNLMNTFMSPAVVLPLSSVASHPCAVLHEAAQDSKWIILLIVMFYFISLA